MKKKKKSAKKWSQRWLREHQMEYERYHFDAMIRNMKRDRENGRDVWYIR